MGSKKQFLDKKLIVNNFLLIWKEPYRATRIRDMIRSKGNSLTVQDMKDIQLDVVTLLYYDFKPFLSSLTQLSSEARRWQQLLEVWNGNTSASSMEATVFELWYTELTKLASQETGHAYWDRPQYLRKALANGDPNCAPYGGCSNFMRISFENAVSQANNERWGHKHLLEINHRLLESSPLACLYQRIRKRGGDTYTVNVAGYHPESFGKQNRGKLVLIDFRI